MRALWSLLLCLTFGAGPGPGQGAPADKDKKEKPDKPEMKEDEKPEKKRSHERIGGKMLSEWLKDLRNPDPSIRRDAIQAVQFYGEDSCDAVPDLVWILNNEPDVALRINAANVLNIIEVRNRDVKSVVDALNKQLVQGQMNLRYGAILTLARFKDDAGQAMTNLLQCTRDRASWEVRHAACFTLARVAMKRDEGTPPDQRVTKALVEAARDPAAKVRQEAVMHLGLLGHPHQNMKNLMHTTLVASTRDRDTAVVVWAYFGLINTGKIEDSYLQALGSLLKKGNVPTKCQVLTVMGMLGREIKSRIPDIIDATRDSEPEVVCTACVVLANLYEKIDPGPKAVEAVEDVLKQEKIHPITKNVAERTLKVLKGEKLQEAKAPKPRAGDEKKR